MAWQAACGILVLLGLAWAGSESCSSVAWRLVIVGILLQFVLAAALLRFEPLEHAFEALNKAMPVLQAAIREGMAFVFGYLGGGDPPFVTAHPEHNFVFAFQGLPLILLVSVLSALLFHWRVLPLIVRVFTWILRKILDVGGAVGIATAANVFIGMTEAPLLIRPYLREMDRSGLFIVMTAGMATISGNMFVLYATILSPVIPDAAGNLMTASLLSAPAAIAVAALLVPGTSRYESGTIEVRLDQRRSSIEAIVVGTFDGVKLIVGVAATLVVAITLVSLVDQLLQLLPTIGGEALSLQRLLGWALAPVAWLIGIPWSEALTAGELMGTKIVLNELVAYLNLAALPATELSPQSRLILTYALCGFANLGSLGILLGGLGVMVPERRADIFELGPKSLLAGSLACFLTGAVVALVA